MMSTDFLLGALIGSVLAVIIFRIAIGIAVRRASEDLETLLAAVQTVAENNIVARVEEHDGVFYIYSTHDDTFLVQGSTLAEIQAKLTTMHAGKNIVVGEGDAAVLARLKGTAQS